MPAKKQRAATAAAKKQQKEAPPPPPKAKAKSKTARAQEEEAAPPQKKLRGGGGAAAATAPPPAAPTALIALSGLHRGEQKDLLDKMRGLGVKATAGDHSWQPGLTHVVAPELRRNQKCLAALASGAWLLGPSFVEASREAGHLVPEVSGVGLGEEAGRLKRGKGLSPTGGFFFDLTWFFGAGAARAARCWAQRQRGARRGGALEGEACGHRCWAVCRAHGCPRFAVG